VTLEGVDTVAAPSDAGTRVAPSRTESRHERAVAVPRLLQWVSLAVVVAGVVMGFLGALRTGVSWDEPFHVMRLRNYLDHGWFGLDWSISQDSAAAGGKGGGSNTMVYGPIAMLLLHSLGALLGVEHWNSVSTSPAAYEVRHVGVLLIGLAGTAAAATITRILLGSWRWALVTAATLLALPMWTGHLMFNIKDVPVATGYTITTLALISMVAPVRSNRLVRVLGLAAGIVLMVGTRPAMASAVVIGLLVLLAGTGAAGRFGNTRTAMAEAVTGLIAAAVVLLATYPEVFAHPLNLLSSAEQSASFRNGQDAVYGYVPFHVLAQTPLLLLGFFVIGLVAVRTLNWRTDLSQLTRMALVGAQLFALPLVAIAKHSDLYNGLRQLLFATPAWAIIATVGLAHAVSWARANGRLGLVGPVAAMALVAPLLDQVTLFPYQYAYYNLALDATGVHVPSDYWRVSVPELLPSLPTNGQFVCAPTRATTAGAVAGTPSGDSVDPEQLVAGRYSSDSSVDCRTDPLGPLSSLWAANGLPTGDRLPRDTFYALIDRDHQVPSNCTRLAAVERTRHGRGIAMTYVARCRSIAPGLGASPVAFTRAAGANLAPSQWAYAPEGWVARESSTAIDSAGTRASLTFRVPASCADRTCTLLLDADAPPDLAAAVNGGPPRLVGRAPVDGAVMVILPPGRTSDWITFTRISGAPLGLRVHGLRLSNERNSP